MNRMSRVAVVLTLTAATLTGCTSRQEHPANVAILVLDNFHVTPDPVPAKAGAGSNCAGTEHNLTGYDANVVGATGGGGGLPKGVSHGRAVYQQVKETLSSQPMDPDLTPDSTIRTDYSGSGLMPPDPYLDSWTYKTSGHEYKLLLAGLDTNAMSTTDLMNRLQGLVDKLAADGSYYRIVLNMSFVVVPCDVAGWLTGAGVSADDLRAQYASMIASDPDWKGFQPALDSLTNGTVDQIINSPGLAELTGDLEVPLTYRIFTGETATTLLNKGTDQFHDDLLQLYNDPAWHAFLDHVKSNGSGLTVVPVGAAGNGAVWQDKTGAVHGFRLEFPFAPALWPDVVSVSADRRLDPGAPPAGPAPSTPASISIEPEQVTGCLHNADLAWYSNCGEVMTDGYAAGNPDGIGTSFAAPRIAALEAVYLMATGNATCSGHRPPLNVVDYDGSTSMVWNNVAPPDWGTLCGDFPSHTTLHPTSP